MDDLAPGDTVLLLTPTIGETESDLCADLLHTDGEEDPAVLFVTLTDTPSDRIAFWEDGVGEDAELVSVVHTGGVDDPGDSASSMEVRVVRNPSNLTQFGVEITEALDGLRSRSENIVVCFRSLSALLQYAGTNQAFQFMQVLVDHFKQAGAISHVHMNADAHDKQTVATFTQVFDVVIEIEEDGTHKVAM